MIRCGIAERARKHRRRLGVAGVFPFSDIAI
jgi:hypothetical protein